MAGKVNRRTATSPKSMGGGTQLGRIPTRCKAISDSGSAAWRRGRSPRRKQASICGNIAALEIAVGAPLFQAIPRRLCGQQAAGEERFSLATTMADSIVRSLSADTESESQSHGSVARQPRTDGIPPGRPDAVSGPICWRRHRIEAVQSNPRSSRAETQTSRGASARNPGQAEKILRRPMGHLPIDATSSPAPSGSRPLEEWGRPIGFITNFSPQGVRSRISSIRGGSSAKSTQSSTCANSQFMTWGRRSCLRSRRRQPGLGSARGTACGT